MSHISVVISAWNEEQRIASSLASVTWADELIVIDSGSTDDTAKIAKKYGAIVISQPNNPMLNVNKNFGFTKAKGPWILSLDADEEIPNDVAKEIQDVINRQTDICGYWIPRKNIIFGKWIQHGLWWPDRQLRLFQKGKGKFPEKHVHEYVQVEGKTETLSHSFIHHNYESISQFLRKLNVYTDNEKENLLQANYQLAWYDALRFPISDFLKVYFAQAGYKDGLHGLVLALFQGFYSFVVFTKLWEHQAFEQKDIPVAMVINEMQKEKKDILYWVLSASIHESHSVIRKLFFKLQRRYVSKK